MIAASPAPLTAPRLELRRTRVEDAAAMFKALRDPAIYAFIPRAPPRTAEELAARFARVIEETAPATPSNGSTGPSGCATPARRSAWSRRP